MKTSLNFEDKATKELLSKLDFEYFLNQNIQQNNYTEQDIKTIHQSFEVFKQEVLDKSKKNKKQFFYYCEGQVRKMFTGGLIPALFELDESRGFHIGDFSATGENWAFYQYWRKVYKRKLKREKIWDILVKTGSILAFILTAFKLYEILSN